MNPTFTTATVHSLERSKERKGCKNEQTAVRDILHAIERGKRAEDFSSKERTYLQRKADDDQIAVAYADFCYILGKDNICVTMFPLPSWFGKKKHYDGKERIRNLKVYTRNHIRNDEYYMS